MTKYQQKGERAYLPRNKEPNKTTMHCDCSVLLQLKTKLTFTIMSQADTRLLPPAANQRASTKEYCEELGFDEGFLIFLLILDFP